MSNYNLTNGRTPEQLEQMRRLEESGICAFCSKHFNAEHKNPVEFETDNWVVTKNDYPYQNTKLHVMLIPKVHVKTVSELSKAARSEYLDLIARIETHWNLESYAQFMRSGDIQYNGATVEHLHAHVIVGDYENDDFEPVRVKLASKPKD